MYSANRVSYLLDVCALIYRNRTVRLYMYVCVS